MPHGLHQLVAGEHAARMRRESADFPAFNERLVDARNRAWLPKIENFLAQSRDGRREISSAIARTTHCTLAPRVAVGRLNGVQHFSAG